MIDAQSVKNTDTAKTKGYDAAKKILYVGNVIKNGVTQPKELPHLASARQGWLEVSV